MTAATNNILLPYLEDTGLDGKKLYIPKEWTERMRHYTKRIHDIDIKLALSKEWSEQMRHYTKRIHDFDIGPALSDETIPTNNGWTEKEPLIRRDFIWGAGPSAIEMITKGEFNTGFRHNQHRKTHTTIQRLLHA